MRQPNKSPSMNRWSVHWLKMAHLMSEMSKDPSTQCGAVVATDKRLLGMGYNGFPPQIADNKIWLDDRPTKYSLVIHAEYNAIINAYQNNKAAEMVGACLYVTQVPCAECAKLIVPTGISAIVFQNPHVEGSAYCDPTPAQAVFAKADVTMWEYTGDQL